MATNLAQARRNYYGDNTNNGAAGMDSGALYYNANGSRTGARIDGRVKRKTMMGGASQGPISMRPNRSEAMEQEAEAAMERQRQRGVARAQAANGSRPDNGVDVMPGSTSNQPTGRLIPGSAPGSSIWVKNGDPRLKVPESGGSSASTPGQKALLAARRSRGAQMNLKAAQDRNFSRRRADIERNPEQYAPSQVKRWSSFGDSKNKQPGMADTREESRKRGDLNPPKAAKY